MTGITLCQLNPLPSSQMYELSTVSVLLEASVNYSVKHELISHQNPSGISHIHTLKIIHEEKRPLAQTHTHTHTLRGSLVIASSN